MHIGRHNPNASYTLADYDDPNKRKLLEKTDCERDLGVLVSKNLKHSSQVDKAASNANRVFSQLKNAFESRDISIWTKLYKTYIRPQMEYAIQCWSPYLIKDVVRLENVQRRVTKVVTNISNRAYEDRCRCMNLPLLSYRRIRGDLIQQYKIHRKIESITWHSNQSVSSARAGRRPQLRREIVKSCSQRYHFFTNRVVNFWNALPDEIVNSKNVNEFKNKLDHKTVTGRLLRLTRSAR